MKIAMLSMQPYIKKYKKLKSTAIEFLLKQASKALSTKLTEEKINIQVMPICPDNEYLIGTGFLVVFLFVPNRYKKIKPKTRRKMQMIQNKAMEEETCKRK